MDDIVSDKEIEKEENKEVEKSQQIFELGIKTHQQMKELGIFFDFFYFSVFFTSLYFITQTLFFFYTMDDIVSDKEIEKKENKEVEKSQQIFEFGIKTLQQMKELGITSLNIVQSPREIYLKTEHYNYTLSPSHDNIEITKISPIMSQDTLKKSHGLSGPAMKLGLLLHQLLLNLNKLPNPAPIMNPLKFEKTDLYIQALLRKLERGVEFSEDDDDFLLNVNVQSQIDDGKNEAIVISEIDLLKNEDEIHFNLRKEEAIKILSCRIGKIYDKILEEYVEEEGKRRQRFRSYVNILEIQRKIETYCCLYKDRNKGETIKNQSTIKILSHNPKISAVDLKNILRAARRIESLINVANNNWGIIDAFPNIDVRFFKSTSINVHNYESWLKLVETGKKTSEEEGKVIYQAKKQRENQSRKDELSNIYRQANIISSDFDINWEIE
jgi:hypothetical protein